MTGSVGKNIAIVKHLVIKFKNMKNKYLLLLALALVFFSVAGFASALEVPLPGLSDNPTLPQYVVYFFNIGISLAGILALISFTVGAIGLINPSS